MPKILFVATVVKTHIMEFHIPYLKMCKEMGWETAVVARNDYLNPEECVIPYCDAYYDAPFERNPFKLANIKACQRLKRIIDEGCYDIIHCHTPVGAALTRLAASDARKRGSKVFYTAHGFHFYTGAPLINWLAYYPLERWLAHKTDVLITINREDYQRAKAFKAGRVEYVPGVGIDVLKFQGHGTSREEKRKELGLPPEDFTLLSVGELIPRKNHAVALDALTELKKRNRLDGISYLICGSGSLEGELRRRTETLGLSERVHFLGYRDDIRDICHCSDLFVFMSLQEGLPVALMEAMACGLPAVCSNIRGNNDLIESGKNGELIDCRPQTLADTILKLRDDAALRERYAAEASRTIRRFDLSAVRDEVGSLYMGEIAKFAGGGVRSKQSSCTNPALAKPPESIRNPVERDRAVVRRGTEPK